jgi:predicted lysophospholipase L1 biosynthesis ABC-type transport system permease subunit
MGQATEHKLKIVGAKDPDPEVEYQYPTAPGVITQRDLAELAVLRKQKRELDAAVKEKRFLIRFGLEHGAMVEPGTRSARINKKLIVA